MLRPIRRGVVACTFALSVSIAGIGSAREVVVSDFEGTSLAGWTFSNGPEFPGAKGSLSSIASARGSGARLAYDLSNGGNYVSATRALVPSVSAEAFALFLRHAVGTKPRLRLNDATGQTLQYDIGRPLEGSFDASSWYRVVVDVSAPSSYYGGANDGTAHPPFASIGVLAVPDSGTSGSLDFDEVVALSGGLEVALDPEATPLIAAPSDASELAPRLGVSVHTTNGTPGLDLVRDAGFTTVRLDFLWQHVELTKAVYNFAEFDAFVNALSQRGLRLHMILDYENPLYPAVDAANFSTVTIPAFGAFAKATARHFAGKGVTYEIWNEPNTKAFWPGDAALYAALCRVVVDAVHSGDSTAKVTTGGISGFDLPFLRNVLANGGVGRADAIGVHPYRSGGGETVGADLLRLRNLLATTAAAPTVIWDTEWGYSSTWEGNGHGATERNRHAQLVSRELLAAWAVGFPLIVYYELRDGGTDATNAEHNFGLLQNDYTEKPAMAAVKTLTRAARERRYVGLLQTQLSSLHAMRLDGGSDITLVVWTDNARHDTLVHFRSDAVMSDFLGRARQPSAKTETADVTLREADGPIYVTFGRSNASSGSGASGNSSSAGSASGVGSVTSGGAAAVPNTVGGANDISSDPPALGEAPEMSLGPLRREPDGCNCHMGPRNGAGFGSTWGLVLAFAAILAQRRYRPSKARSSAR